MNKIMKKSIELGKKLQIQVQTNLKPRKVCCACNGSGYYDTTKRGRVPKCSECNGTGFEILYTTSNN